MLTVPSVEQLEEELLLAPRLSLLDIAKEEVDEKREEAREGLETRAKVRGKQNMHKTHKFKANTIREKQNMHNKRPTKSK